jgi:putative NADH-flavin reductase
MKIVIFGATGGTGFEMAQAALGQGYEVRAAVRNPAKMDLNHPRLEVFKADIYDSASVMAAIEGQEAVLSSLSPGGFSFTEKTDLYTQSAKAILPAMQRHQVQRLLVISTSAQWGYSPDNHPIFELIIKNLFWRTLYSDVVAMDKMIMQSEFNWTLIRPPQVVDRPFTGNYRANTGRYAVPGGSSIGRADLAAYTVSIIGNKNLYQQNVAVAY